MSRKLSEREDITALWHSEMNAGYDFSTISLNSNQKFWWLGECGHEWERTAAGMNRKTIACPYCAGKAVLPGFNDLGTTHPDTASQWHPTKNGVLCPENVMSGSHRKVWWLGGCAHEWEATVQNRTRGGQGCPYCAGQKVLQGFNDIATTHPESAAQWHPVKNKLNPTQLTAGSHKKIWWLGVCGHEWEASPNHHVLGTQGCAVCRGLQIHQGKNDLQALDPVLAAQWHPIKNNNIIPQQVTVNSSRKVWWLGDCGHEWEASPNWRTGGNSCPYCAGRKVLAGFNDLQTINPVLAAQWHSNRNGRLTPSEVTHKSGKKVWWLGDCGHEWETSVSGRTFGYNCPYCVNQKVLPGFNDLATTHPQMIPLWDSEKNVFTPEQVTAGSGMKTLWVCSKGHEWERTVHAQTILGVHCSECHALTFTSKAEKEVSFYVQSLGLVTKTHERKVVKKTEIDIYVPEKKIGIEFNGLYWHSEAAGRGKTYHHSKWLAAKRAGVQLIQIWEDDWNRNPNLVKRMLAHKLGVSQERTVFARKTGVVQLTTSEAEVFLNLNHIQGYASGSYYLGLRDNEKQELVAVLVLKKEPGTGRQTLNITRYATSVNVVGGFTKLLTYAERAFQPEMFITFADHTVSNGGLYENNGFVADKELTPDYMYVVKGERKHKFGYRLKKFGDDPNLKYIEGLTERELATLNNLPRIWDAGKTRYKKTVK